jgi:hypothetical protein
MHGLSSIDAHFAGNFYASWTAPKLQEKRKEEIWPMFDR